MSWSGSRGLVSPHLLTFDDVSNNQNVKNSGIMSPSPSFLPSFLIEDEENFGPAKPWHRSVAAPSSAPPEVIRRKHNT